MKNQVKATRNIDIEACDRICCELELTKIKAQIDLALQSQQFLGKTDR